MASISDIKTRLIPDKICVAIALSGLINFNLINIFGIVIAIPFFIAAVLTGEECMGGGDIKIIAAMGFALGYTTLLKCIYTLFIVLGMFMVIKRIAQGNCHFAVPLIPFLTISYIIAIIMEVLPN